MTTETNWTQLQEENELAFFRADVADDVKRLHGLGT